MNKMTAENKNILGTIKEKVLAPVEQTGRLLLMNLAAYRAVRTMSDSQLSHHEVIAAILYVATNPEAVKGSVYLAKHKAKEVFKKLTAGRKPKSE